MRTILPAEMGAELSLLEGKQATRRKDKDVGADGWGRAARAGGAEAIGDGRMRTEQAGVPCGGLGVAFKRRGLCPEGSQ